MTKFTKFIGQQVDITIGTKTYLKQILYFAGKSLIGHDVITTAGSQRGIFYITDWSVVKIKLSK